MLIENKENLQLLLKCLQEAASISAPSQTIKVFVQNSPALNKYKLKNVVNKKQSATDISSEIENHNSQADDLAANALVHGTPINLKIKNQNQLNLLKNHENKPLNLSHFINTFETEHPYEMHEISYTPTQKTKDLTHKITVNSPAEVEDFVKNIGGKINNTRRGVMYSRLTDLFPYTTQEDRRIIVNGSIHHAPIDDLGNVVHENTDIPGDFSRKIVYPNDTTLEKPHILHDTLGLEDNYHSLGFASKFYENAMRHYRSKLGLDHIKMLAGSTNGAQTWAKKGAVMAEAGYASNSINKNFKRYLNSFLQDEHNKTPEEAENLTNALLLNLAKSQYNNLIANGKTHIQALDHLDSFGLDPWLIGSLKIKAGNILHNVGYDFLSGAEYPAAIPLHKNSPYGRSFHIVARRFPSLLEK